ncbi:DnaD domain-containing protein, partial [Clostridium botulinum]
LGNELVIYAINIAAKSNVRKWNFIEKILIDWDKNGIKTLNQAKAYSQNRRKGGQKENDRDRTDNTKDEVKYDFSRFGG